MPLSGGVSGKKNSPGDVADMRHRFNPWIGKISWRRAQQTTPVFLPRESYEWRSLVGYDPQGSKESDTSEVT